jgi:type I restriction enzyme S subunit
MITQEFLGKICDIKTGKLDVNAESSNGKYPFFTCAEKPVKIDFYDYDCECVLIAGNGEFAVNYYNGKFNAYQRTYIVTAKDKFKDETYLPYLYSILKRAILELKSQSQGSIIQYLRLPQLETLEIPFPKPDEQKRIAAILDKADRLRRQRHFAQTLSDSFLQSVFIKMFGDIYKNEKSFEIGELDQKLSFMTSGSRGWAEHYTAKGDLFLRIQNVNKGELLLNDIAFVQAPETAEARRTKVKEGDVLLTITAALGRSAVIPKNLPTAYINQHIALLRVKDINPTFVSHFITSRSGQIQIKMLDREGVKSGLNFDDIKGIRILLPPLPLQEKFAEIVQKFERIRRQQREATRQAEHLFQTLLHRAFRGEL